MKKQLFEGEISGNDAIALIPQMVYIRIKNNKNQINNRNNEEDIQTRDVKLMQLHTELFELRNTINSMTNFVKVESTINIE